jgi:hypothetical protein
VSVDARRGLSSRLGLGLLTLIVLLALASMFIDDGQRTRNGSARARGTKGRRAAAALLAKLGSPVVASDLPPGEWVSTAATADPTGALWMAALPTWFDADADGQAALGVRIKELGPVTYRTFIEGGGTVVLPSVEGADVFVRECLQAGELADWLELADRVPVDADAEDGQPDEDRSKLDEGEAESEKADQEEAVISVHTLRMGSGFFELNASAVELFERRVIDSSWETFGQDQGGRVAAVLVQQGEGRIAILRSDAWLSNEMLPHADHAPFFVHLAREFARGGPTYFDEFALGEWDHGGMLSWLFGKRMWLLTVHVFLALALIFWRAAWPREFARDPEGLDALSPLERSRSEAELALRAGRPMLLARRLRLGVLQTLCRRYGLSLRQRSDAGDTDQVTGADEHSLAMLEKLLALTDHTTELSHWRARLFGRGVRNSRDLDRLASDLDKLGEQLEGSPERLTRGAPGHLHTEPDPAALG